MSKPSLLSRLTGAVSPPGARLASHDLARRLSAAEAQLAEHRAKRPALALDALSEVPEAQAQLVMLDDKITAEAAAVETLRQAKAAATDQELQRELDAKATLWRTRNAAYRKHLDGRRDDAKALADALAIAVPAYQRLLHRSNTARSAHPDNSPPKGALLEPGTLQRAITQELARLWTNPIIGERYRFPGSAREGHVYLASEITPLVDVIEEANTYAKQKVTNQ